MKVDKTLIVNVASAGCRSSPPSPLQRASSRMIQHDDSDPSCDPLWLTLS